MLFNRVPEYEGAQSLIEASQEVLDERHVYGAIVRNTLSIDARELLFTAKTTDKIYDVLPVFKTLDPIVANWVATHSLAERIKLRSYDNTKQNHITNFGTKYGTTPAHYDSSAGTVRNQFGDYGGGGPLTYSARIDPHDYISRRFTVYRPARDTLRIDNEDLSIKYPSPWRPHPTISIVQNPGDIFIFANQPRATEHQVSEGDLGVAYKQLTCAVLLSYYLDFIRPIKNNEGIT